MAERPVFIANVGKPCFMEKNIPFTYYSGFSIVQKQRSICSLHTAFNEQCPGHRVLEISSKSDSQLGVRLSAFNLKLRSEGPDNSLPDNSLYIENVFQSSKVFENGGPYTDLLFVSPKDAKRDERLQSSGKLIGFNYLGKMWSLEPKTIFYDWLYMSALSMDEDLSEAIMEYDAFTDIEFNPKKSVNCQARSAAIFVSLKKQGILMDALSDMDILRQFY